MMSQTGWLIEDAQKQAMHDRSVIDHLFHAFPPSPFPCSAGDTITERSPAIYHSIRKTWTAERHHELLCTARGAD
jgi:hypothetical protein